MRFMARTMLGTLDAQNKRRPDRFAGLLISENLWRAELWTGKGISARTAKMDVITKRNGDINLDLTLFTNSQF
jgi:hypothetical protein